MDTGDAMRALATSFALVVTTVLSLIGIPGALGAEDSTLAGGEVSFHLGAFEPRGGSDLWRDNKRLFTQDISDYDDLIQGIAFASHVNPHFDFQVGADYYDATVKSSYREFSFSDEGAIAHEDRFRTIPIDLTFKFLPISRTVARGTKGRRVLRPVVPYLGAGVGGLLWDYRQTGRFLDLTDPNDPVAFRGDFHARGITGSFNAMAGFEIQFSTEVAAHLQGRYRWAKDRLGSDFDGFDRFDLGGTSIEAGASFRF